MTSNLFGLQNNVIDDGIYFSDAEDDELNFDKRLPPSVNQRIRKKNPEQLQTYYNDKQTSSNTLTDNQEQQNINWEEKAQEYTDLKDEIATKVTNHTNKLINNLENVERKKKKKYSENCLIN